MWRRYLVARNGTWRECWGRCGVCRKPAPLWMFTPWYLDQWGKAVDRLNEQLPCGHTVLQAEVGRRLRAMGLEPNAVGRPGYG